MYLLGRNLEGLAPTTPRACSLADTEQLVQPT